MQSQQAQPSAHGSHSLSLLQFTPSEQNSSAAQTGHTQSLSPQVALQPKHVHAIGSGLVQKEAKAPMQVAGSEPP